MFSTFNVYENSVTRAAVGLIGSLECGVANGDRLLGPRYFDPTVIVRNILSDVARALRRVGNNNTENPDLKLFRLNSVVCVGLKLKLRLVVHVSAKSNPTTVPTVFVEFRRRRY